MSCRQFGRSVKCATRVVSKTTPPPHGIITKQLIKLARRNTNTSCELRKNASTSIIDIMIEQLRHKSWPKRVALLVTPSIGYKNIFKLHILDPNTQKHLGMTSITRKELNEMHSSNAETKHHIIFCTKPIDMREFAFNTKLISCIMDASFGACCHKNCYHLTARVFEKRNKQAPTPATTNAKPTIFSTVAVQCKLLEELLLEHEISSHETTQLESDAATTSTTTLRSGGSHEMSTSSNTQQQQQMQRKCGVKKRKEGSKQKNKESLDNQTMQKLEYPPRKQQTIQRRRLELQHRIAMQRRREENREKQLEEKQKKYIKAGQQQLKITSVSQQLTSNFNQSTKSLKTNEQIPLQKQQQQTNNQTAAVSIPAVCNQQHCSKPTEMHLCPKCKTQIHEQRVSQNNDIVLQCSNSNSDSENLLNSNVVKISQQQQQQQIIENQTATEDNILKSLFNRRTRQFLRNINEPLSTLEEVDEEGEIDEVVVEAHVEEHQQQQTMPIKFGTDIEQNYFYHLLENINLTNNPNPKDLMQFFNFIARKNFQIIIRPELVNLNAPNVEMEPRCAIPRFFIECFMPNGYYVGRIVLIIDQLEQQLCNHCVLLPHITVVPDAFERTPMPKCIVAFLRFISDLFGFQLFYDALGELLFNICKKRAQIK